MLYTLYIKSNFRSLLFRFRILKKIVVSIIKHIFVFGFLFVCFFFCVLVFSGFFFIFVCEFFCFFFCLLFFGSGVGFFYWPLIILLYITCTFTN